MVFRAIKTVLKDCIISIDTRKSAVAKAAIEAQADIVNDVSGGRFDPMMLEEVVIDNKLVYLCRFDSLCISQPRSESCAALSY
jgi:dihydropteroate synthase